MTAELSSRSHAAVQLCYVRLAVAEPQVAAAFATEVLGLQHVPNELEPFLFRSDERYHTLCLAGGTQRSSIGIEITDEPELDRVARDMARDGFSGREATSQRSVPNASFAAP